MSKRTKEKQLTKKFFSFVNKNAPFSYVEAYKKLCTNIEFITATNKCKKLMITSTLANEGKTNVSVNLCLTLSGYGKKVCLVECDLRRPTIHRYINSKRHSKGVTDVLTGDIKLDDAINKVGDTNFHILLSGTIPPNPSELLASENMKNMIDELEKRFDYVIFDTPPVLLVTDAVALGKFVDGAVYVVRYNSTDKNIVIKAKKSLEATGVKIFGAIFSNFNERTAGTYSGYSRYSYSYYGHYGYGGYDKPVKEAEKEEKK